MSFGVKDDMEASGQSMDDLKLASHLANIGAWYTYLYFVIDVRTSDQR